MTLREVGQIAAAAVIAATATYVIANQPEPVAPINVVGDFAKLYSAEGEFLTIPELPGVVRKTAEVDSGETLTMLIGPNSVLGEWSEWAFKNETLAALACNLPGVDCEYDSAMYGWVDVEEILALTNRPGWFRIEAAGDVRMIVVEDQISKVRRKAD